MHAHVHPILSLSILFSAFLILLPFLPRSATVVSANPNPQGSPVSGLIPTAGFPTSAGAASSALSALTIASSTATASSHGSTGTTGMTGTTTAASPTVLTGTRTSSSPGAFSTTAGAAAAPVAGKGASWVAVIMGAVAVAAGIM